MERGELSAVPVTLHYDTDPPEGDYDPHLEDEAPPAGEAKTKVINAFVHQVSVESIVQRGYTELKAGDLIVDFAHNVDLSPYRNLKFEIRGRFYVQGKVGAGLTSAWDAMCGGVAVTQPVLLTISG